MRDAVSNNAFTLAETDSSMQLGTEYSIVKVQMFLACQRAIGQQEQFEMDFHHAAAC